MTLLSLVNNTSRQKSVLGLEAVPAGFWNHCRASARSGPVPSSPLQGSSVEALGVPQPGTFQKFLAFDFHSLLVRSSESTMCTRNSE